MKILIAIWGPEYGCLYREIEIAKELIGQNHEVKFIVHQSHTEIIESCFGKGAIIRRFSWKIIKYREDNDLDIAKTFFAYLRFWLFEAWSDFGNFKKEVRCFKPDIVISDFIPHVIIFSRLLGAKCVGVFNYALIKWNIELPFWQRFIHRIAFHTFKLLYGMNSLNIIETFMDMEGGGNTVFVKPIAINKRGSREILKKKLGIKKDCTLVFYGLGGVFANYKNLFLLDRLIENSQDIKVFVLARNKREMAVFKKNLKNILVVNNVTTDPSIYIYHADLIITKCGFRTVADSLRNKCLLLPIHMPNHPEIYETELLLRKNKLVLDVLADFDEKFIDKVNLVLTRKDILKNYDKISFCNPKSLVGYLNKIS